MFRLTDYPLAVFAVSLITLWAAAKLGARYAHRIEEVREDFSVILAATLTLLGLIVGFTFSMAVGRYDQRKNYEEEEANAIGTEYLRLDLLPDAANARKLLREYLDQRILNYQTRDGSRLQTIDASTAQLQAQLWTETKRAASAQPTPIVALAVSGMNDVLNAQGYAQAAWLNRIPVAAWTLLGLIALCANVMVGLSLRKLSASGALIWILPIIVSIALLLIADLDALRGGLIRVQPENLISLAESIRS